MKVVLLNMYYAPAEAATAQILDDVAVHLASAGHDVTVVCSGRDYPEPRPVSPRRQNLAGVDVRRTWATGFGRGSRLGRSIDYLTFLAGAVVRVMLVRRPDVVVSLTTPPMLPWVGMWLARVKRARAVFWAMDVYPDLAFRLGALDPAGWGGRALARMARQALRGSDAVIALGETMADRLRSAGARRVTVVHNWADGRAIRPRPAEDHPLRKAWGEPGDFIVLYSGNLGLAHEFETVLEAAAALADDRRFRFVFVGDGPRKTALVEEAARRGLSNLRFETHVPRERLGLALTAGDVHLITLRDGMQGHLVPSKIYGILAAGVPPLYIGPDAGEIADILREGACGVRVPNGDGPALADAIRAYAADPARRREEGRRARNLFDRRFDRASGVAAARRAIESAGHV